MSSMENSSPVGRLLEEISWEGNAKPYREGGRGRENVLTVEVLTPLDYLPRRRFLGQVLSTAHGADDARNRVLHEVDQLVISVLPGDVVLGSSRVRVQPDATMISPSTYVLVEAKRIRKSSFQENQLAREFVAVLQQARDRTPLMLLILGSPPPVTVQGAPGRTDVRDAIAGRLPHVVGRVELGLTDAELRERISEVVAWTTWDEIRRIVQRGRADVDGTDETTETVGRLADATVRAIDWHS